VCFGPGLGFGLRLGFGDVSADGLEHDVEPASIAEGRDQARGVEPVGAEIVEDRPPLVEQRFGVDQLERPRPPFEDGPAGFEVGGPIALDGPCAFEVSGLGGPEDRGGVSIRGQCGRSFGEDFAQFGPSMGPDHDRLATFEPARDRLEATQGPG
jgi:hypothetical protein